jgi:hypothetical protein
MPYDCADTLRTTAVLTFPDYALFAAAVEDRRFWAALAIAILAGVVRGFSGFGSALIYIPLVAAAYSPPVAAVTLLLIDSFGAAPFPKLLARPQYHQSPKGIMSSSGGSIQDFE